MTTLRPLATMLTPDSHPRLFTIGKHVASAVGGILTYVFEEELNGTSEFIWHSDVAGVHKRAALSKAEVSMKMETNVIKELIKQVNNGR